MKRSGPITVVKISGKPIEHPEACAALWGAIADLAKTDRVVVVHGGGAAVDRRLAQLGIETPRVDGLRVTDEKAIGVVAGVLAGEVNTALVGVLRRAGVEAAGVGLSDGGLCRCEAIKGLGRVGRVLGGDPAVALALLNAGFVPVVHSIGMDATGGALNVNADDAAAGVARVCGAARLVLITDVDGVRDHNGLVVPELTPALATALIGVGAITTGMMPKVNAAIEFASRSQPAGAGTGPEKGAVAVIGSWSQAGALLTGVDGVGTRVVASQDAARGSDTRRRSTEPA